MRGRDSGSERGREREWDIGVKRKDGSREELIKASGPQMDVLSSSNWFWLRWKRCERHWTSNVERRVGRKQTKTKSSLEQFHSRDQLLIWSWNLWLKFGLIALRHTPGYQNMRSQVRILLHAVLFSLNVHISLSLNKSITDILRRNLEAKLWSLGRSKPKMPRVGKELMSWKFTNCCKLLS